MATRRDCGDTDLGFVHLSGPAPLGVESAGCAGDCWQGRRDCTSPDACRTRYDLGAAFRDSQAAELDTVHDRVERWAVVAAVLALACLAAAVWVGVLRMGWVA